ncbi:MAG TPA: FAD-binding protein [Meiothermus sp.]|nr:FAD-binding protein [Meiothermus sp.]
MVILRPSTPQEVQEMVRTHDRLLPRGGGTKTALSTPRADQTVLDLSGLSGVLEYDPGEYVFVAKAGTRLAEIQDMLAQNGQYLPFDPPFVEAGATLGGTVAAGLSGPMRQRYGGVRDFILGVRFVDGEGNLLQGGGKVVKNAAGFDLPKLMVGSLGRLGGIVEVAFKVFPFPKATATLKVTFGSLEGALEALYKLSGSVFEFYALDLEPNPQDIAFATGGAGNPATLTLRIGGLPETLPARLDRLRQFLGNPPEDHTLLEGEAERSYWAFTNKLEAQSYSDPASAGTQWEHGYLVKVPLQPSKIPSLEASLGPGIRRYLAAGNLLYLSWPDSIAKLDALLKAQGLSGLVLRGSLESPWIGVDLSQTFGARVTAALDPSGRFSSY